ncbi:hypothetical protein CPLU01_07730 [Colletotrichum plurivorum]|uniref:DUF6546 domain-containing protein n=1 Tax=Colletotrichum plurivorum TaxID=2175906 RepID=A0A8H6NDR5_9PEZI|nr:hypothetical protein CPLU01_07730 [Colletotrichum plurivorum]
MDNPSTQARSLRTPDLQPLGGDALPPELALMVLKFLMTEIAAEIQQSKYGLPRYACVSKTWLDFFERKAFRYMTVDQRDLQEKLSLIIPRRRSMVEHIWLRIELATYDCPDCKDAGKNAYPHDKAAVENAIVSVFKILHGWDQESDITGGALTLEISAHSPSDSQHIFKDYLIESKDSGPSDIANDLDPASLHDRPHGWSHGRRTETPGISAFSRMHKFGIAGSITDLPQVKIITGLLIRRQMRRTLSPDSLTSILRCLPQLETLHFECWKPILCNQFGQAIYGLTMQPLSTRLKKLVLFEDFSEDCNKAVEAHNPIPIGQFGVHNLEATLVERSLGMESLSISYLIGARRFFQATKSHWVWSRLTSLSLTSPLSKRTQSSQVTDLLVSAAAAAERMPVLKTMQIWNGGRGHAYAFSCEVRELGLTISWKGTWKLNLNLEVVQAWMEVNKTREEVVNGERKNNRHFEVKEHPTLDANEIRSHGDAIRALQLTAEVVHPVSLKQIRREAHYSFN